MPLHLEGDLLSPDKTALYQEAMRRLVWALSVAAGLMVFAVVASVFVNANDFSLHGVYRNRLVRTFLGASNLEPLTNTEERRSGFTGFSDQDDLRMHEIEKERKARRGHRVAPFHVVNMTLNLTETRNTAWQERKAASFISTPLHTGGDLVGYRSSSKFGEGMKLGTAMAISGAAVSPNWGYHSSPLTSFLMSLFNVRLGSWQGNPRNNRTCEQRQPWVNLEIMLREALGRTSDEGRFVYLSDGGHFENLGLYEMVRRRCHTIVVSDAGADPSCALEDLGNAIRKIAIDLDVKIIFDRVDVAARDPDRHNPGVYCAMGRIVYPEPNAHEGRIIYIKAGLYGDAPADVRAYAASNAQFPHDSTLNQWFTESQFESYRALGSHAIRMIVSRPGAQGQGLITPGPLTLEQFVQAADDYLGRFTAAATTRVRVVA
jgi:hypothetical protein